MLRLRLFIALLQSVLQHSNKFLQRKQVGTDVGKVILQLGYLRILFSLHLQPARFLLESFPQLLLLMPQRPSHFESLRQFLLRHCSPVQHVLIISHAPCS
jgi:hypothetical protein